MRTRARPTRAGAASADKCNLARPSHETRDSGAKVKVKVATPNPAGVDVEAVKKVMPFPSDSSKIEVKARRVVGFDRSLVCWCKRRQHAAVRARGERHALHVVAVSTAARVRTQPLSPQVVRGGLRWHSGVIAPGMGAWGTLLSCLKCRLIVRAQSCSADRMRHGTPKRTCTHQDMPALKTPGKSTSLETHQNPTNALDAGDDAAPAEGQAARHTDKSNSPTFENTFEK